MRFGFLLGGLPFVILMLFSCLMGERPGFTIATTTSVDNSGLLRHLADEFQRKTAIEARWVSVGSGKALQLAAENKVDLVISHDPDQERKFVATGRASLYEPFARNDFVLIGPPANPARIAPDDSAEEAFRKIVRSGSRFVSRGDSSGTHSRETAIWSAAGVDPKGEAYISLGQSMTALLRSARELDAYALSDAATYLQVSRGSGQKILLEGDPMFRNVYSVILLRSGTGPESRERAGRFAEWLLSPEGTEAVAAFSIEGKAVFTPGGRDR
ncbi:MAG TPA: substrate-binding domain-containing protein [Thermoanaerobaculia bacterium]|nr:substrate-binding domain-containing protein [Thermoanaerobaculia bacterium]